jgi:hypothetical protein
MPPNEVDAVGKVDAVLAFDLQLQQAGIEGLGRASR